MKEITTGSSCATVPICKLPLCPSYRTFALPSEIKGLKVSGYFRPTLLFEWDKFTIKNTLTDKLIDCPQNIKISFWEALKIKQMLHQPYFVYVILSHQNYV